MQTEPRGTKSSVVVEKVKLATLIYLATCGHHRAGLVSLSLLGAPQRAEQKQKNPFDPCGPLIR